MRCDQYCWCPPRGDEYCENRSSFALSWNCPMYSSRPGCRCAVQSGSLPFSHVDKMKGSTSLHICSNPSRVNMLDVMQSIARLPPPGTGRASEGKHCGASLSACLRMTSALLLIIILLTLTETLPWRGLRSFRISATVIFPIRP
jgi:hypothetical protein